MSMTVGSLFAGIGGFDLGFERAGFEIRWQVEIDDYARRVLAKHWPNVQRYGDIRSIDWSRVEPVDVICGGFPCQPHSLAGRRGGAEDERDLWGEFARIIREVRPRWVVAENVPGLLSSESGRFFGRILRDLAACGYDAEWDCLPASAFGAPHRRDRVWLVADADQSRSQGWFGTELRECASKRVTGESHSYLADADDRSIFGAAIARPERNPWATEPDVGRVADGIPARVDRLKGLGNAIVPQIAQWIGERIKESSLVMGR